MTMKIDQINLIFSSKSGWESVPPKKFPQSTFFPEYFFSNHCFSNVVYSKIRNYQKVWLTILFFPKQYSQTYVVSHVTEITGNNVKIFAILHIFTNKIKNLVPKNSVGISSKPEMFREFEGKFFNLVREIFHVRQRRFGSSARTTITNMIQKRLRRKSPDLTQRDFL